VVWLVMREVMLLVGLGVAIGLPAALGLTRLVQAQLFGVAPSDGLTLCLATARHRRGGDALRLPPRPPRDGIDPMRALHWDSPQRRGDAEKTENKGKTGER
jgi:hypothetical protein